MQHDIQGVKPARQPAKAQQATLTPQGKHTIVSFFKKHVKIIVIVVVLAVLGTFAYLYIDARNQIARLSDPSLAGQLEGEDLVKEVGKWLALPQETPTLATVNDAVKLQTQEFFKEAKDGDKVLIFPKAGRALLYRPSTHKVIEYSKVNLNTSGQ